MAQGEPTAGNISDGNPYAKYLVPASSSPNAGGISDGNPYAKYLMPSPRADRGPGAFRTFMEGFNKSVSDLWYLPEDARTSIVRAFPELKGIIEFIPLPSEGVDYITTALGAGTVRDRYGRPQTPTTPLTKVASKAGEMAGATVPYMFALPAMGARAAAMKGAEGLTAAGRYLQAYLAPLASPTTATVGAELGSAAMAGAGGEIARQAYPDSPLAEFGGELAGGLAAAPLAATYRFLKSASIPLQLKAFAQRTIADDPANPSPGIVGWARRRFGDADAHDVTERAAKRAVSKEMQAIMSEDKLRALDEAEQLRRRMGGEFNPTLGQKTGSAALLAEQRNIESKARGAELDSYWDRLKASIKAVDDYAARMAPKPEGDESIDMVIDAGRRRITDLSGRIEEAKIAAARNREEMAGKLPTIARLEAGEAIRSSLQDARNEARARMARLSERLGIANADVSADFSEFQNAVRAKYAAESVFEDKAARPRVLGEIERFGASDESAPEAVKILRESLGVAAGTSKKPVTFQDVKALRERISDDLIDAMGEANPSRRRVRTLAMLKRDVDGFIDGLGGELAGNYKAFRQAYLENVIQPFERGAAFRTLKTKGTGEYATMDERVASAFLETQSGVRQYKGVFGDDPAAMRRLQDALLDDMRAKTVKGGVVDPRALETWRVKNAGVLSEMPDVRDMVMGLDTANRALIGRQKDLLDRARHVESRALGNLVRRFDATGDVDSVIATALDQPKAMRQLVNAAKQDGVPKDAVARAVWDRMMLMAGERGTPDAQAKVLDDLVQNKARSLAEVFSPQHLEAIRDIIGARRMLGRTPAPVGKGEDFDPMRHLQESTGLSLDAVSSRVWAAINRRVAFHNIASITLAKMGIQATRNEAAKLTKEAIYDEDFAKTLLEMSNAPKLTPRDAAKMRAWMAQLGIHEGSDEQRP